MAEDVAQLLLDTEAVAVNTENLFQFVSGIRAPIYIDNRRLIAFPAARTQIVGLFVDILSKDLRREAIDVVAGVATGGIPWAAWIAEEMNLPMAYVRSEPKDRGRQRQVEGAIQPDQKAIVVEDTVSTGSSTANAIDALRRAGAVVSHCLAIFTYDAPATLEMFRHSNIEPHALTKLASLVAVAERCGYIDSRQALSVRNWASSVWRSAIPHNDGT
jgi:orotate phosphoribosyltransferase